MLLHNNNAIWNPKWCKGTARGDIQNLTKDKNPYTKLNTYLWKVNAIILLAFSCISLQKENCTKLRKRAE